LGRGLLRGLLRLSLERGAGSRRLLLVRRARRDDPRERAAFPRPDPLARRQRRSGSALPRLPGPRSQRRAAAGAARAQAAAMTTPLIANVSDTARWVAFYRAMESERPDAIFHDPYARQLAGEQGEAIVASMPRGKAFAWPMIVRTAGMGEIILRVI